MELRQARWRWKWKIGWSWDDADEKNDTCGKENMWNWQQFWKKGKETKNINVVFWIIVCICNYFNNCGKMLLFDKTKFCKNTTTKLILFVLYNNTVLELVSSFCACSINRHSWYPLLLHLFLSFWGLCIFYWGFLHSKLFVTCKIVWQHQNKQLLSHSWKNSWEAIHDKFDTIVNVWIFVT